MQKAMRLSRLEGILKKMVAFFGISCYTENKRGSDTVANVFDVAKYILEKEGKLSTMKLQKLCYYCQAWSLV